MAQKPPSEPDTGIVVLDVGGVIMKTTKETLRQYPNSMLACMFAGQFSPAKKQADGSYFVDSDPDLFKYMLQCMRRGHLDWQMPPPTSTAVHWNCELAYWGFQEETDANINPIAFEMRCEMPAAERKRRGITDNQTWHKHLHRKLESSKQVDSELAEEMQQAIKNRLRGRGYKSDSHFGSGAGVVVSPLVSAAAAADERPEEEDDGDDDCDE